MLGFFFVFLIFKAGYVMYIIDMVLVVVKPRREGKGWSKEAVVLDFCRPIGTSCGQIFFCGEKGRCFLV